MGGLDLLILVVLLISLLIGLMRGFVYEALMLLGWVLAFFIAKAFAPNVAGLMELVISNEGWRMGLAYIILFITVLFINAIIASFLKKLFTKSAVRPVDRFLGSLFGILRAAVIIFAVTLIVHIFRLHNENWWTQSYAAPVLDQAMDVAKPYVRSVLNLEEDEEWIDRAKILQEIKKRNLLPAEQADLLEKIERLEELRRTGILDQDSPEAKKLLQELELLQGSDQDQDPYVLYGDPRLRDHPDL